MLGEATRSRQELLHNFCLKAQLLWLQHGVCTLDGQGGRFSGRGEGVPELHLDLGMVGGAIGRHPESCLCCSFASAVQS